MKFAAKPLLLLVVLTAIPSAFSDDVIGCGGFIKASKVLDFSRINVQLYSKAGSLKFETECAPNNGYFFIPVYEKGSYTIKVSPPLGWKFSPSEVVVDIDGVNDDCSANKDINFNFDGFGVVGRVITAGTDSGPGGVTISLKSSTSPEALQTTVTEEGGHYVFTAVPGTDHHVAASHPSWVFEKDVARVSMTGDNGQAEDLVIAGFDVRGEVSQPGGEAMPGVSVLLFGGQSQLSRGQCPDNVKAQVSAPSGLTQLCHIKTDNRGRFMFPVVPPGKYKLVPFYQTSSTKFEVTPQMMDITVTSNSLQLPSPFIVSGFSVEGLVLASAGGQPLSGAQVTLAAGDKTFTVMTDKSGKYRVESIVSSSYTLTAKYPGMEFTPVTAKVTPTSPTLPIVTASKYEVMGRLDYTTVAHDSARKIAVSGRSGLKTEVDVDVKGSFSSMLPSDTYSISVQSTPVDRQMGIVFAPVVLDVNVKDAPVTDLYFSPVRVTVSGTVKCLGTCPALKVVLKPEGFGKDISMEIKNGAFLFENQLPGSYIALVQGLHGLCFQTDSIPFKIESDPVDNLHFQQTGWVMDVQSSHETVVKFTDTKDTHGDLDIPIGQSTHCMPSPGPYKLSTVSCHIFHEDASSTGWKSGDRVVLRAVRHLVSGTVATTETIPDLQMMVTTESKEVHTIALTSPENRDGLYYYKFGHNALPHEQLIMEPIASKFLFHQSKLTVTIADDCQLDFVKFTATKGLFVSGLVTPALEGVAISVESDQLPQPATTTTDKDGKYSLGPFNRDIKYSVKAEKLGYVITEIKAGSFSAKKLASVVVNVVDSSGAKLSGVVVSLSGGENNFRTNEKTGPNGSLSFLALSPGEYFVKPVLKEYDFEPKSKLITVKEGAEEVVQIVGKRVAFSAFGTLTSLRGDPEPGIVLEAVGQGEDCAKYQEEGVSGSDGQFRIRGLQPSCSYHLQLKLSKSNYQVERTIPSFQPVTVDNGDVTGIELIAIRPKTSMDVSLMVKINSKKENVVKNIKAKLFCGDSDSPIHTVKMDNTKFYIFPSIPSDGKECYITVEANAVQANQRVKTGRVVFIADKPFEHHKVELELESSIGRGDIGQASWLTLPVIILLVTLVLQWDKVSPVLRSSLANLEKMITSKRTVTQAQVADMSEEDINKAVKFVEASTRKKVKPKKI